MTAKKDRPALNQQQKSAAFCEKNAVVSAGAGSGKTMVLANRFAWLITEKGLKVDEILTLTFTKKAAAQMYRRIYSQLLEIAEKGGEKAKAARCALDDFYKARIQTLDSYSTSLLKQCASRYGISPDFSIDQTRCYNIALEVSFPYFIKHRRHPAIERLYIDYRPNNIAGDIFADILFNYCQIDTPRDFISDIKKQIKIICIEYDNHSENIKKTLQEIEYHIMKNNEYLPQIIELLNNYKKDNIQFPDSSQIQNYFNKLLNSPAESCIDISESDELQSLLQKLFISLKNIADVRCQYGIKYNNPVKDNIYKLRELMDLFLPVAIYIMQAGLTLSIMSLITETQNIYLQKKRSEGVLTFSDIAKLARTILIEQHDIRQAEKESFKAIMIDEFQDNNELQKDLLFLLAEKPNITNKGVPSADNICDDKLFFVGDEKQSIFRFRGADVSVFNALKTEIKSANLPLKINYRSAPKLIGAFNAVFGGSGYDPKGTASLYTYPSVFAPSNSIPNFEAGYTPLETNPQKNDSGNISFFILNKQAAKLIEDDTLSSDENEARFTAEKIRSLLTKYEPKDIAILFRSRSAQYLYEKHLRLLDIPYTCEQIEDLFYGGLVNDILSVLRLTAHPADSFAYAEMLRSPFAGLSLSGTALCLSLLCEKDKIFKPFDDEPLSHLDETDKEKYSLGQSIYKSICELSETQNISSLVSELWYKAGYRYETEWNSQTNVYKELFDHLFHLAVNADAENTSLANFIYSVESFNTSHDASDSDLPLERPSAVNLMSIHKSKGLEFPVVFLCGCGRRTQYDSSDIVFLSNEAGIVFSSPAPLEIRQIFDKKNNYFWQKAKDETNQKRLAELRRLLYVGMTRAEKELYITGSLDIMNLDETDNFPLLIKNYIEEKCSGKENKIEGDSILNDDTFFGLLLPSIAAHISSEGIKKESCFFNLEEIPIYTEEYIKTQVSKTHSFSNDQKGLNEFIKKAGKCHQHAEVIKTDICLDNHKTPVSLKSEEEQEDDNIPYIDSNFSSFNSNDIFKETDSVLNKYSKNDEEPAEKFNSGSFGTIAHICVEAYLNGEDVIIPSNISGLISPSELDTLIKAGKKLASRFIDSPLGKIAKEAKLRESEFPFRSLIKKKTGEEVFINGTIDLFFEDNEIYHIVDFKTDNREIPTRYTAQMACYYHAVTNLFSLPEKKECRIWLYYLRTGHAIEMTKKVKKFKLEERDF